MIKTRLEHKGSEMDMFLEIQKRFQHMLNDFSVRLNKPSDLR